MTAFEINIVKLFFSTEDEVSNSSVLAVPMENHSSPTTGTANGDGSHNGYNDPLLSPIAIANSRRRSVRKAEQAKMQQQRRVAMSTPSGHAKFRSRMMAAAVSNVAGANGDAGMVASPKKLSFAK